MNSKAKTAKQMTSVITDEMHLCILFGFKLALIIHEQELLITADSFIKFSAQCLGTAKLSYLERRYLGTMMMVFMEKSSKKDE